MTDTTVILGAGLAGLACGRVLGDRAVVLEKASEVGGTARSSQRDGFTFDITGHWLHLATAEVRSLVMELMGEELVTVERRAEVHSHGVRTPYPFQANTYGLPPNVIADCVLGFFRAREARFGATADPRNFEDFIRQRMGDGIADHFMIPYNTKLWTVPPSAMAHEWTGRFVPMPTAEEVVLGAVQPRGAGHALGYNSSFFYPKSGGIQTLAKRLATNNVRTNAEVMRVDLAKRQVYTRNDATAFTNLVSTLPLTTLIDAIADVPASVREARSALTSTSVTYWNLGFEGANRPDDAHWIYFPESKVPFYRAGSPSAAVASLAPPGHRSYYVEVAHRTGSPCTVDDEAVLDGMREVGLIAASERPVLLEKHTVPTAYVIMDMAYGAARAHIMSWLASQNVSSIGRYGAWIYDSMEGAIAQGLAAGKRLLA